MQTFHTPAPVTAIVDIPAGQVRFIAADRAETTVEVRPADASNSRDVQAAGQTQVAYADGELRIEAGPAASRVLGHSGAVEVTIQLPAGSHIQATASDAEFRGVGRLGTVTVDASRATVKIDEAATARLALRDGGVAVGRLGGDADIRTSRGDIEIAEAAGGSLQLSTQDGAITVGVAAGVSAALDAGATYGRIHNALTNTGTPALTIHATTTRGDITARSL